MISSSAEILYESKNTLQVWDWVVLGVSLLISTCIGLYFAWTDRHKKNDVENYLMAGRSLPALPVALSLTASFMSAVTVLGTPADYYNYGTMFTWFILCYVLSALIAAVFFIPLFYESGVTSAYEYLELQFNSVLIRRFVTAIYIFPSVLYNGIVIYTPAVALNQVAGVPTWFGIVVTGGVCMFYTTLGGLKAVVWTDSIQIVTMMLGFVAVIVKASFDFDGGFSEIWEINKQGGRIVFDDFRLDPTIRHSFLSVAIGGTFGVWGALYCINQAMVQRYVSCKSLKTAQTAVLLNVFGLLTIVCLAGLSGLCMFAYFANCDPISMGWVKASDQLLPYLSMIILEKQPGLVGLYIAGAFSGTLSSVSSGMNSLATCTLEDLVKPAIKHYKLYHIEARLPLIAKCLVFGFGLITLLMAFVAQYLGDVVQAALSVNGVYFGPILGLFYYGIMCEFRDANAGIIGTICGLIMSNLIWIGQQFDPPGKEQTCRLEFSTEHCMQNVTEVFRPVSNGFQDSRLDSTYSNTGISYLFHFSYVYMGTMGVLTTFVTSYILSFIFYVYRNKKIPNLKPTWNLTPKSAMK